LSTRASISSRRGRMPATLQPAGSVSVHSS
jgi:hypothetical protein